MGYSTKDSVVARGRSKLLEREIKKFPVAIDVQAAFIELQLSEHVAPAFETGYITSTDLPELALHILLAYLAKRLRFNPLKVIRRSRFSY